MVWGGGGYVFSFERGADELGGLGDLSLGYFFWKWI